MAAPTIGATKLDHLNDVLEALDIKLPAEEKAALEEPYLPHPVLSGDVKQNSHFLRDSS